MPDEASRTVAVMRASSTRRTFLLIPFLSAVLWAGGGSTASSQTIPPASAFSCTFPVVAQLYWESDAALPEIKKQEFAFDISSIDTLRKTARMSGQGGSTDLLMFAAVGVISFIEQTPLGGLNVTSVFAQQDARARFKAVHSRHVAGLGPLAPQPSQNYGYCVAK